MVSYFSECPAIEIMRSSAIAGCLASTAGILGKLGSDEDTALLQFLQHQCSSLDLMNSSSCIKLSGAARVACLGLMLLCNARMVQFFVRGLHETDSLTATITSAATNFLLSALGGFLVFQEQLPLQWWLGASLILMGMTTLLYGDNQQTKVHETEKKTQ